MSFELQRGGTRMEGDKVKAHSINYVFGATTAGRGLFAGEDQGDTLQLALKLTQDPDKLGHDDATALRERSVDRQGKTMLLDSAPPPVCSQSTVRLRHRVWRPAIYRHLERTYSMAPAFRLAALTGMRRGEVLGLRWRDIDWDFDRLSVRHTIVSVAYDIQSSTPKTHQARVIDLDAETMRVLREHRERMLDERAVWGDDFIDDDLVFCREDGSPVHPDVCSQIFENEVRKAGLPRIRLHDLRHTHATLALTAGVPVKVISEHLGHESPAFTMKQYAHEMPGMQAEAAAKVAELLLGKDGSNHSAGSPR